MNLDNYQVFHTVAQQGQISKAAEKLYVSQSAVSQSVRQLEKDLDILLFDRTPKGVVLTYEGQLFYEQVDKGLAFFRKGQQILEEVKNLHRGEIAIAAGDSACSHYLLDKIEVHHNRYPDIKVHVYNKTSSGVVELLRQGVIDFGFVNTPIDSIEDIELTPVMDLQDCFVCASDYELDARKRYSLDALLSHPLIALEKGTNMRRYLEQIGLQNGCEIEPAYEVGSADLLLRFAAKGFGIAFVTKEFCSKEIDEGQIKVLRTSEKIKPRNIAMVTEKDRQLSKAAESFLKKLGIGTY